MQLDTTFGQHKRCHDQSQGKRYHLHRDWTPAEVRGQVKKRIPETRMAFISQPTEHLKPCSTVSCEQPRLRLIDVHLMPPRDDSKQYCKHYPPAALFPRCIDNGARLEPRCRGNFLIHYYLATRVSHLPELHF